MSRFCFYFPLSLPLSQGLRLLLGSRHNVVEGREGEREGERETERDWSVCLVEMRGGVRKTQSLLGPKTLRSQISIHRPLLPI